MTQVAVASVNLKKQRMTELPPNFTIVAISATDNERNTGTKICSIVVIPGNHYGVDDIRKSEKSIVGHNPDDFREEYKLSTKCYVISKIFLECDPNLDTTLVTPPLPKTDINSKAGKGSKSVMCHGIRKI